MEAQSPIPSPLPNDDEDVSWALSTAGALWGRGERVEALKWLRRAAEQASDSNDDVRALALFKAAAEATPHATTPPPPSTTSAPPAASVPPPSTAAAPAPGPQSGSFPPPSQSGAAPPPRKGPPSLPPRNSRPPPVPSTRTPSAPQPPPQSASPQTTPLPASQLAPPQTEPLPQAPQMPQPPQARGRSVPSANVPSPVTKPSQAAAPQAAPPQSALVTRPQPSPPIADAATTMRRPEPQRTPLPARPAATPSVTVPTRPVAFSRPGVTTPQPSDAATRTIVTTPQPRAAGAKGAATTTPQPGAAADRAPGSRRGRVFDEITALGGPPGGQKFDDLDENTQVIQAAKAVPISRKSTAQEIEESFRGLLVDVPTGAEAESGDEPTDPGLHAHQGPPPEDATQPISAPTPRTVPWSAEERAAISSPESHGPELTSRRFAPLLAHRVAIVASSTPGELRVVPLDTSRAPPAGAAIVLIVPLSGADDHVITQLLGSLE